MSASTRCGCQFPAAGLLLFLLFTTSAAVVDHDTLEVPTMALDDECSTMDAEGCSLNAMQLRHGRLAGRGHVGDAEAEAAENATPVETTTVAVTSPEAAGSATNATTTAAVPTPEVGEEEPTPEPTPEPAQRRRRRTRRRRRRRTAPSAIGPYQRCGGKGWTGPTRCIEGYACWPQNSYFWMCRPQSEAKKDWKIYNGSAALREPSAAPLLSFYMYRAQARENYGSPRDANTGSLEGVMWYVHNEVVSCAYGDCQYARRFGINRILRYKALTRATTPLYEAGMNFGLRYAFDVGQCTGPWDCSDQFEKYGYFVGCNNLSSGFPFPTWPVYYGSKAVWYSLPGQCPEKRWQDKSYLCNDDQPGGACKGEPTGTGTCTYSLEPAGEILIDELENITNYAEFRLQGGEEYNKTTDEGVNMTFWNGINNTMKNLERVQKANELFARKYPDMPTDEDLPDPVCDFDFDRFFPDGEPQELNQNAKGGR